MKWSELSAIKQLGVFIVIALVLTGVAYYLVDKSIMDANDATRKQIVAVKAEKDCPARMGDVVGVAFDTVTLHIFDGATGERLPDPVETHSKVTRLPTSKR